jgi:hypothetical protein
LADPAASVQFAFSFAWDWDPPFAFLVSEVLEPRSARASFCPSF